MACALAKTMRKFKNDYKICGFCLQKYYEENKECVNIKSTLNLEERK